MIPLELSACFDDEFTCTDDGKCVDIEKRCDKYPNCKGKCRLPCHVRNPPTKLENSQTSVADTREDLLIFSPFIHFLFIMYLYLFEAINVLSKNNTLIILFLHLCNPT